MLKSKPLIRWFVLVCLVATGFSFLGPDVGKQRALSAGNSYYVALNGSDSNPGSKSEPFRTVQKCARRAQAGDTCFIRQGTYRETITPSASGTTSQPITFKSYQGEEVTISGADVVEGWTKHQGGIYTAHMGWTLNVRQNNPDQVTNNQIFVDGQMMVEARWPNVTPGRLTKLTNGNKAQADGVTSLSEYEAVYLDAKLNDIPCNLFNGAKINFAPGFGLVNTSCDVLYQNETEVSFRCNPDPGSWNQRSNLVSSEFTRPSAGDYYYLWGTLGALDVPGEWFRKGDGTLYLWAPDSQSPAQHVVEARKRLWAFDLSDRSGIVIDGLELFAAGIKYSSGTSDTVVENSEIRYPWHFQEIPVLYYAQGTKGLEILGSQNIIRDSYLAYSPGIMINLGGVRNSAVNNVIHRAGYMGVGAAIVGTAADDIENGGGADRNEARRNTVFDSGAVAIRADPGLHIKYNDLYRSHQQIFDLGTIYGAQTRGNGAEIAYNLVHDNKAVLDPGLNHWGGHGIYLDDDTYDFSIYRNVVWDTTAPGIFLFGTNGTSLPAPSPAPNQPSNRLIYDNTVDGELGARAKSDWNGLPQTLLGTEFKNNIGASLNLSHPSLELSHNYEGVGVFTNRDAHDYSLRNNTVPVDSGINLGSPYMDSPMEPVGAPDIGALELGRIPFVAGADIRQQDVAAADVACFTDSNGTTAGCQLDDLPTGRRLPPNFRISIGSTDNWSSDCETQMDYGTDRGLGYCSGVPTQGLTGVQPVWAEIDGEWVEAGQTDLGRGILEIVSVKPSSGPSFGGTSVTISGYLFDTGPAEFNLPISVVNSSGTDVGPYPVLVQIDTRQTIKAGDMRSDCGDIRFRDEYGSDLAYWLEGGCNTPSSRLWVRVPYLSSGNPTALTMSYGDSTLASASNGFETFDFFDDFEDGEIHPYWNASDGSFYTVREQNGRMILAGSTSAGTVYDSAFFHLDQGVYTFPDQFAIDSELSVVAGSNSFKASLGTGGDSLTLQGVPNGNPAGKNIAYWNGSIWKVLGRSTVDSSTFSKRKFSVGYAGPSSSQTVRWMENGNINSPLAIRSDVSKPGRGFFAYGPDSVSSFDARFDNVRVRNYVYPEPVAEVGTATWHGPRVSFGGIPCASIVVSNPSQLTCVTPPHEEGYVDITIVNSNGQNHTLDNGFSYFFQQLSEIYLPLMKR